MTVLTGADGFMRADGHKIGKVRNFSISVQRDAVDVTTLDMYDKDYVQGLRNTTGSCTLFYDPEDKHANQFLNSIFDSSNKRHKVDFVLNKNGANLNWDYRPKPGAGTTDPKLLGTFRYRGFLTNVSPSVDVGAAQAVQVSFQACGPAEGAF